MKMKEYLEKLKNKYNYSNELLEVLEKIILALLIYYGNEYREVILNALLDCEIHIQENNEVPDNYLNHYFGIQKDWDIPFVSDAMYHKEIFLSDNQVSSKSIIYLKTISLRNFKTFDFQDDKKISALVHEICHLVKGYQKLKIEDGKIIDSTGLNHDYYEIQNGKIILVHSDNIGLEEAINSYDEAQIMTIMTGVVHEFGSYRGMSQTIGILLQNPEVANIIKISQLNDTSEWIDYFGANNAKILSDNFDSWINCLYVPLGDLLNPDKAKEIDSIMNESIQNIGKFIDNYEKSRNL